MAADIGLSAAFDVELMPGSRRINSCIFAAMKRPSDTFTQRFGKGKLELCEASVSQNASPKFSDKRDCRGLVTSGSVRRGLFVFKLWEMLCLLDSAGQCVPAYLGVRPLRGHKITRAALHFRLFSPAIAVTLC